MDHLDKFAGHEFTEKANELLIQKQFYDCISVCEHGMKYLRRNHDSESSYLKEALCLNTIQSYAELNRWQEVLPFLTNLYGNIQEAPARTIQLCILLHAEVKDYPTCAALANIWLKHRSNIEAHQQESYLGTIDIYIGHVLIPANRWDDIESFIQSCQEIDSKRCEQFMKITASLKQLVEQFQAEQIMEIGDQSKADGDKIQSKPQQINKRNVDRKNKDSSLSPHFQTFVAKVSQWVTKTAPVITLYVVRHITVIAVILYIIITQADTDVLSWKSLSKLWLYILHLWRRMFAPFHTTGDAEGSS